MQLENKVALVTGAASGIGKAIAQRLAREGAHVVIDYRPDGTHSEQAAQEEAQRLATPSIAIAADVSKRDDVESLVRQAVEHFGRLDIAVSNAGIEIRRPFLDISDDEWHRVMNVNLYGSFLVAQTAARVMVQNGSGGRLIFTSSVHEDIPFPGYTPYCVSKGGMRMLMRNLSVELAPHNITANNIAPGAIATPINEKVLDDPQQKQKAEQEVPLARFGRPEEVAAVAVFLASEEAAYVTGSTYYIDGGMARQVTRS